MSDNTAVYVIKCKPTGRVYVGSSIRPKARIRDHKSCLAKGTHRNKHLQNAWNKYGAKEFSFRVVERCAEETRFEVEQKWITKLSSTLDARGFNVAHPVQLAEPSVPMSEVVRKSWTNKVTRQNRHGGIKAKWNDDPEFRKRKLRDSEKARKVLNERRKDPEWRATVSAKTSATMKARSKDPAVIKQLQIAAAVAQFKRREDPEFKKRCEAGLRGNAKKATASNEIV